MDLNSSQSRRKLFSESDDSSSNDDLGHMSLLSDSDSVDELHDSIVSNLDNSIKSLSGHLISDYVILENINENNKDKHKSDDIVNSPGKNSSKDDTPSRKSPNFTLKTPQDAVVASDLPKLVRKSPFKTSTTKLDNGKRKLPFSPETDNKTMKLDQLSKIRTVLFPTSDEISVPVKSFYGKTTETFVSNNWNKENVIRNMTNVRTASRLRSSRRSDRRRLGQFCNGVAHRIRKPKKKKMSRTQLLKAALTILDNSSLNEYFDNQEKTTTAIKHDIPTEIIPVLDSNVSNEVLEKELDVVCSRKRELSPPPDMSKKFFKFKRSSATEAVDKYKKHLQFHEPQRNGSFHHSSGKQPAVKRKKTHHISFDTTDLTVPDNTLISSGTLDNILSFLDDDTQKEKESNQIVLHAYDSVSMSDNSIHLHSQQQDSMLLSPTSLMCNMTSGLALNSPKKQRNLFNHEDSNAEKMFPIFYEQNKFASDSFKPIKVGPTVKKAKPLPEGQMFLDAGQKKFGATTCPECNFLYHMGDPSDEQIHLNYHNSSSILRFAGWKEERVVSKFLDARIIKVLPTDPKPWLNKVKDLLDVVNRDLGYYEMPVNVDNTQIFLYIRNKTIMGCLVAEAKTTAHQLLSSEFEVDICSETSYPVKCGVIRIWVSSNYRKLGVATSMLNSLRANFMFGGILAKEDIAFSSPTEMGKLFATRYFNTPNFLVYTS